jgi:hypothetical protein
MRPAAAAAVVFLLLTAAAGTSAALSPATLLYRWQSWAQSAEEEALEGRRQPSERPAAPVLSLAQPSDGQPAALHVSLQLPNHQLLEVHEHSSLEDIVTKLLSGQVSSNSNSSRSCCMHAASLSQHVVTMVKPVSLTAQLVTVH